VGASFEPKTSGEALKLIDELGALGCRNELRDVGLQRGRSLVGRFEHPTTIRGHAHSMGSTIAGVRLSLGVSKTFEIVYEPNHHVSVDAERVGQLLLGRSVRGCHAIHNCEVTGLNLEWFEPLGKRRRQEMPDLRKKEHRSTVERFGAFLGCQRAAGRRAA
jgi:hypothetical protein